MANFIDTIITPAGRQEWKRNWPVVVGAMVGLTIAHIHLYSLGVMVVPLEQEFGWPRTQITSGLLVISVVMFLLAPLLGIAIDRVGPRRIALTGITIYCCAVASLSLARATEWTWWVLWGLVAVGFLFLNPTVWVAAVSRRFDSSRGLALSVVLSATGIISFAAPLATYGLVSEFGWRQAYLLWGAGAALIGLPIIYFCFSGDAASESPVANHQTGQTQGYTFSECIRTPAFRKLLMAGPVMAVVFTAVMVNAVLILTHGGLSTATAAAVAGAIGVSQSIGRLVTGFLIDRFNPRHIGAAVVLFPVIASVLLASFTGSIPVALLAVILFGLAAGAELDVLGYLSSHFFGMRSFGAVFGIVIALAALGTGIGPTLASIVYDNTGSYYLVLVGIIPLCLLSSWSFFSLGAYPDFDAKKSALDS